FRAHDFVCPDRWLFGGPFAGTILRERCYVGVTLKGPTQLRIPNMRSQKPNSRCGRCTASPLFRTGANDMHFGHARVLRFKRNAVTRNTCATVRTRAMSK